MEFNEFSEKLIVKAKKFGKEITEEQAHKLFEFMNLILEYNEKINLTRIVEPNEFIIKHFLDSLTIKKYILNNSTVIDIGTGAGFPGIPLKIADDTLKLHLLDSLNKRINFLNEVIIKEKLDNIYAIHGRAEEIGRNNKYREKFDYAVSRAVAQLNILLEYMLPLVKVGGKCICMKGPNVEEEINNSKNAIKVLGGEIEKIENINLFGNERNIIIIKKIKNINNKYPRTAGKPSKEPL